MAETRVRSAYNNPKAAVVERSSYWNASVDNFTKPPAQDPDAFDLLEDVEPVADNRLNRRRGYTLLANPTVAARRMFEAHFGPGTSNRIILAASDGTGSNSKSNQITAINESGSRITVADNILVPSATTGSKQPWVAVNRGYAYINDAGTTQVFKKWTGEDDLLVADTGAITIDVNSGAGTFTRSSGSFVTDGFAIGDDLITSGFANAGNNIVHGETAFTIGTVTATVITVTNPAGMVTESGSGDERIIEFNEQITDWGLNAEVSAAFTVADNGAGNITTEVGRKYFIAFRYDGTEEAVLMEDANGEIISVDSGVLTARQTRLSSIPVYTLTGTGFLAINMHRLILATEDGGPTDTLYEVGRITNNTTTTFDDNVSEDTLLANPVWAQITEDGREIGIYDNTRPKDIVPSMSVCIPHRGRLYAIDEQYLYWSKNFDETITSTNTVTGRWESSWPASYQLPLGIHSEFGRGLLSDGIRLYIATDRGIRALDGDYPYFNGPRTLFHEVGLMRQDTWQTVFHEGQQVGAIWLTPDRRVIASDFNTYGDIGKPIQALLDTIVVSRARLVANAGFFNDGGYELYMLAVPAPGIGSPAECDVLLVYDVKHKRWFTWYPAETNSGLASPGYGIFAQGYLQDIVNNRSLWMFSTNNGSPVDGRVYRWHVGSELDTATNLRDRNSGGETPVTYDVNIRTSWLDWGLPQVTKLLNELEVMTGDSGLTVAIHGASTDAQFTSPVTVMSATAVTAAPFGQYKISLATKFAKYRFYRFTFNSPAGTARQVLDYFACEGVPVHRF